MRDVATLDDYFLGYLLWDCCVLHYDLLDDSSWLSLVVAVDDLLLPYVLGLE